jgi:flagellar basal body-associated protein FliL
MGDDEKIEEMDAEEGGSEGEGKEASGEQRGGGFTASRIIKILIYFVGGLFLVFMIIGISYLVSKYVQERSYQKDQDIVVAPPPPPLAHYDLPTFQTTTSDEEPHFAKVTLSLGFEDNPELLNELISRTVQIQHMINIIMRGKKFEELNSEEDAIALTEEIKAHVNVILIAGKIREVYLKEIVVN